MNKKADGNDVFFFITMTFFIIFLTIPIVLIVVSTADVLTLEYSHTEKVACVDERRNKFVDELCDEKVYCSWLGFVGDYKCGEEYE